jgi:putative MATE family efflux protein
MTMIIKDWTQGSVLKNLFGLSWPMALTEGFGSLVMTVDLIWVGRLGSAAIASAGVGGMVSMLVMGANVGLIVGVRAIIARFVGARDISSANHAATQALVIAVVFGLVAVLAGVTLAEFVMNLFGLEPHVVSEGVTYVRITLAGALAFSLRIAADNIMQASGDTLTPMKITILTRSIHLLLAPAIILGWWVFPQMGVTGAALINVFTHTFAMVIGLWVLITGRSRLRLNLKNFRIDMNIIRRMVKIGMPASIMNIQRSLGYLVLAWFMAPFGTFAVAGHSLLQRIDILIILPTWAIGSGAGVLVGQNLGAQQVQRAVRSAWLASAAISVVMIAVTAAILLWAESIVGIFSNEPALVDIASTFLRIAAAGYLLMALTVVLQQALSGAGDTMPAMLISMMMIWVVQLPLAYFLPRLTDFGVYGVRWALVIGIFAGAVAYIVYFHIGRWKRKMV